MRGVAVAFGNLPSETAGGFCGASQGELRAPQEALRDVIHRIDLETRGAAFLPCPLLVKDVVGGLIGVVAK